MSNPITAGAVIYAKDITKVGSFYAAITDLSVTETEPGHVVLEAMGFQLVIVAMRQDIADRVSISEPPTPRTETAIKPVFFVPSIKEARVQASANGGLLNPPNREWQFQGSIVCDGNDPEGNIFQLRAHSA
ncbi:VOC family protein [Geothrix sp. PMB-07]|uniref:VOC family protein n=1 Tax=Geothrix sp. PMB-07 TaxID=3068640 RepID=UPI002742096B|nr:hypothetical protein [Geothrix sp. PMB-07]WLT32325.1 hypothetical protein Q9293_03125 [Geothrix sp. PMB-07]